MLLLDSTDKQVSAGEEAGAETARRPDPREIQGVVVKGYGKLLAAGFLFFRIQRPGPFKAWLREQSITSAADAGRAHSWALNIAFTHEGLKALGLGPEALETFPDEFQAGMEARRHVLGDTGRSAPEGWEFGSPARRVDVLLLVYLRHAKQREAWLREHLGDPRELGLEEVHAQWAERILDKGTGQFREPFGFKDGISQPVMKDFLPWKYRPEAEYEAPLETGEFILGYRDERGQCVQTPLVPGEAGRDAVPLGLNGSYLVVRKLEQDVKRFEEYVRLEARRLYGEDEGAVERLEAKLMGRYRDGRVAGDAASGARPRNDFTYLGQGARDLKDPHGFGCPVTSHIRRCNPRDSLASSGEGPKDGDGPSEQDRRHSLAFTRRHRILRRGMPYEEDGGGIRGLMFLAINANIQQQFEFIQQNWLNNGKFGGVGNERDPVTGNNEDGQGSFTIPGPPIRKCLRGVPSFVTVKGGGYFFLPSRSALAFLARLPER